VSLYRHAGRATARALALVGLASLLVGGGIGYAIGAAGGEEAPTVREAVAQLRADLGPVEDALDLVPTEYRQAVRGGRVVASTEYAAARSDVARAHEVLTAHADDLRALSRSRAARLERLLDALNASVDRRVHPAEVDRLAGAVAAALRAVLAGR
jgi:hypothetical protein